MSDYPWNQSSRDEDAILAAAARQHVTPKLECKNGKWTLTVSPRFDRKQFERDLSRRLKVKVTKTTFR
jgi:hypothetical protein